MTNESTGTQSLPDGSRRRSKKSENAIRWVPPERPRELREPVRASPNSKEAMKAKDLIPESVRSHFVQVGKDFFFSDGTRAFTDKAVRLTTASENSQVIQDLMAIAQARGWTRIALSGTERFRKEALQAAKQMGLEVKGSRASEFERERVARRAAGQEQREAPRDEVREKAAAQPGGLNHDKPRAAEARPKTREHVGRLIEHGLAPYQHDPHEATSYFVKLETQRGEREIWGVDLERAFRESLSRPQIGDEVVLRAIKREPVTVRSRRQSDDGPAVERELSTHRNRWVIEQRRFFEEREKAAVVLRDPAVAPAQGARSHPELVGAYLQVHAAELAAKQFRDPQDRERFVALVRSAIADSIQRGEALPAVRMREGTLEKRTSILDGPSASRALGRDRER